MGKGWSLLSADPPAIQWDYDAVAAELAVDPGTRVLDDQTEIEALHVSAFDSHELVTVVEIISPSNKTNSVDMRLYLDQRERLFLSRNVNVVKIETTRSLRRLIRVDEHAYHIAIHLPGELPHMLISDVGESLKPFALPLRGEAVRNEASGCRRCALACARCHHFNTVL